MSRRNSSRSALRRAADPKVLGGVVVMAGSAFVGLAAMGAGPQTSLVAVAQHDLAVGVQLQPDDYALKEVVIGQPHRYVGDPDFTGSLAVPVGKGELIPRSALADDQAPSTRLVALAIEVERLPPDVGRGSKVDVWRTGPGTENPVLSGVDVASVTSPDQWAGATATVVLSVKKEKVAQLLEASRASAVDITMYQDPA